MVFFENLIFLKNFTNNYYFNHFNYYFCHVFIKSWRFDNFLKVVKSDRNPRTSVKSACSTFQFLYCDHK